MSKGDSFIPLLAKWMFIVYPHRILEWGPGKSTRLMARLRPDAEIITYEHDYNWFKVAKQTLAPFKNVDLRLREKDKDYSHPDVKGKFDLIFVDGRERVECMKFAKDHLAKYGALLLHDCERPRYEEGVKLFRICEELEGTLCLMQNG